MKFDVCQYKIKNANTKIRNLFKKQNYIYEIVDFLQSGKLKSSGMGRGE